MTPLRGSLIEASTVLAPYHIASYTHLHPPFTGGFATCFTFYTYCSTEHWRNLLTAYQPSHDCQVTVLENEERICLWHTVCLEYQINALTCSYSPHQLVCAWGRGTTFSYRVSITHAVVRMTLFSASLPLHRLQDTSSNTLVVNIATISRSWIVHLYAFYMPFSQYLYQLFQKRKRIPSMLFGGYIFWQSFQTETPNFLLPWATKYTLIGLAHA